MYENVERPVTCSGCLCRDYRCHHKDDEDREDGSSGHGECNGIKVSDVTYVGTYTSRVAN